MIQQGKFNDKVVLITGGTTGIGAAAARLFQAEGATVMVTGRDPATLQAARESMPGIEVIASDAGSVSAIRQLVTFIKATHHRVDILFVNAAISKFSPIPLVEEEFFDAIFAINVRGPYFLMKQAAEIMSDGGAIVITSSISGVKGVPGQSVYAASKAAIRSYGRTFAKELAQRGIRVNIISPGPIDTQGPIKAGYAPGQVTAIAERIVPLGRIGQPEEVAAAALFLASKDASYITGIELFVDGGLVEL